MNREIKFRAWQKWHEYMFTPDYIDFINGNVIIGEHDGDSRYEDIPLMQYTGLKDKNGKEIYEGDILKASNSIIKIVFKGRGYEGIYLNKEEMNELPIQNNNYLHWQIIGNIYENPELTQS